MNCDFILPELPLHLSRYLNLALSTPLYQHVANILSSVSIACFIQPESVKMSGKGSSSNQDDWKSIEDPTERRKVQNRVAQRRHSKCTDKSALTALITSSGEKTRHEDEEKTRIAENQSAAGSAYTTADPRELERNQNPTGLPWGSYAIKRPGGSSSGAGLQSQRTSREGSISQASHSGSSRR